MGIKVSSFDEVSRLISGNPLRQFPTMTKGRERLFPYARPRVTGAPVIPRDARFFLIGACFARSLGRSLSAAGRTVLSVQGEEDVPGVVQEQFNRYNVFNLDVGMNEVKWALDAHEVPIDAALVELRGQWIDSQKHWAFAYPEDEARAYRQLYNRTYSGITDADVVILALASHRQWFDTEKGIYINAMPARNLTSAFPGRFVLHEFGPEGAADRLRNAVDTINILCPGKPQILVCISPVWQPMSVTEGDSLTDQLHSRAIQRVATEKVVGEYANLHYLPALEAALLGDFELNFLANNPTHNTQNLADRVISDLLADTGSTDIAASRLSARAHAEAALTLDDFDRVLEITASAKDSEGRLDDPALARVHATALRRLGRREEALGDVRDSLPAVADDQKHDMWTLAVELAIGASDEQIAALRSVGHELGLNTARLDEATRKKTTEESALHARLSRFNAAVKARGFAEALEMASELAKDRGLMLQKRRTQFDVLVLRSLRAHRGDAAALDHAIALAESSSAPDPVFLFQAAMVASNGQHPEKVDVLSNYVAGIQGDVAQHPLVLRASDRLEAGKLKAAQRALRTQSPATP